MYNAMSPARQDFVKMADQKLKRKVERCGLDGHVRSLRVNGYRVALYMSVV
jgi:hypothetical protein